MGRHSLGGSRLNQNGGHKFYHVYISSGFIVGCWFRVRIYLQSNAIGRQMAIKNSVSSNFLSTFDSIHVFDCHLSGVVIVPIVVLRAVLTTCKCTCKVINPQ